MVICKVNELLFKQQPHEISNNHKNNLVFTLTKHIQNQSIRQRNPVEEIIDGENVNEKIAEEHHKSMKHHNH